MPPARAPVFIRVKPLGKGKTGTSEARGSLVQHPEGDGFSLNGKQFSFPTGVIGDGVSQEGAYSIGNVDSYVSDFLDGVDVNVLAYGQTGSGKTHTTFGPPGLMQRAGHGEFGTAVIDEYGLFPRALYAIIDRVQEMRSAGRRVVLTASCVELSYGMNLDMLFGKMPAFTNMQRKPAKLFGQTETALSTREDALGLFAALATRNSRATLMNDSSSRSHCFVTLTLLDTSDGDDCIRESRLQFVDMAGSERLKDAHGKVVGYEAFGDKANLGYVEGMVTNYSLMMLSQCIRDVAKQKDPTQMSFRTYKIDLVFLLQASLMGSARTILYVCLHQSAECDAQSYNAVDFGLHFATIRIRPTRRAAKSVALLRKQYEGEQREAEEALERGCVGKDPRSYADIKDIRQAQLRNAKQSLKWLTMVAGEGGGSHGVGAPEVRGASSCRAACGGVGGSSGGSGISGGGSGSGSSGGGKPSARVLDRADDACEDEGHRDYGDAGGGLGGGLGLVPPPDRYRFGGESMFSYRLNGLWDAQAAAEQRFGLDTTDWKKELSKSVEVMRKEFAEGMQYVMSHSKANRRYADRQAVTEYEIDCGPLGGDNPQLRVLIHTPKGGMGGKGGTGGSEGGGGGGRRGLIYFHGGGTVVGSAHDYSINGVCPRIACDSDLVVINVDYRLAPEAIVPAGITDGVCACRWAFAHGRELGINPSRIAVGGDSGGGYIAVGACAELARCGEADGVALLVAISPQTSNFFRRLHSTELERLAPSGLRLDLYKKMFEAIGEMMLGGASGGALRRLPKHDDDPQMYPNLMDAATAASMPKAVVFTSEFDMLRIGAEELAAKLERQGRLLDYVCHPACTHCWWIEMDHERSKAFWGDLAKVFAKWL